MPEEKVLVGLRVDVQSGVYGKNFQLCWLADNYYVGDLLKLLNRISSCSGDRDKQDQAFEPLQEVVTFVQFANDECDYGMGLELGVDLFCHGDICFHKVLEHLLPIAYELLGRESYSRICRELLKRRNRTPL